MIIDLYISDTCSYVSFYHRLQAGSWPATHWATFLLQAYDPFEWLEQFFGNCTGCKDRSSRPPLERHAFCPCRFTSSGDLKRFRHLFCHFGGRRCRFPQLHLPLDALGAVGSSYEAMADIYKIISRDTRSSSSSSAWVCLESRVASSRTGILRPETRLNH